MTLDKLIVDFTDFWPQHGLAYVALSRVKSLEGLQIVGEPKRKVRSALGSCKRP
jgi:hypothetical protein